MRGVRSDGPALEVRVLPVSSLAEGCRLGWRARRPLEASGRCCGTGRWRQGLRAQRLELLDGFKRRAAAAAVAWPTLSVRVLQADERQAKAAIFGLNSTGRRPNELEEAWIVQALVREDGLSQVEVAQLLDRHKSWVCRRLALLERLCPEAQADLRLGLLGGWRGSSCGCPRASRSPS